MEAQLIVLVLALVIIAAATALAPRIRLAAPLVLVLVGIVISLLPGLPTVEVEPEVILTGVLPLLLYSSAVSMPAMSFRRDFSAISGLSVTLVIVSALLLGLLFAWLVPGLGFAWGVALGAIISPTDAVATSIIKGAGVSPRAVVLLEGESLLNDATALVLLRTAVVASAAGFSAWGAVGSLAYSVALATVVGLVVGWANLWVRRSVSNSTVNTLISFTVPFFASIPAEAAGASGLVAAVVAGLVTGVRAPRVLTPTHRLSDAQNWETVNLVGEGLVFLTMGLQLHSVMEEVAAEPMGLGAATGIAALALVATVVVRAGFVAPLLQGMKRTVQHKQERQKRAQNLQQKLQDPQAWDETGTKFTSEQGTRTVSPKDMERFSAKIRRYVADVEYLTKRPLGKRDGIIVVWAGMRGAVTVAAAQTLPEDAPLRGVLVFLAFAVATMSLLVQGSTVGLLTRALQGQGPSEEEKAVQKEEEKAEFTALRELLRQAAEDAAGEQSPDGRHTRAGARLSKDARLASIHRQRDALLDARAVGTFDSETLDEVLKVLDADEIALELRTGPRK